ncbi:MAG: Ig-like domain-containing protein [Eubacterium sp.]
MEIIKKWMKNTSVPIFGMLLMLIVLFGVIVPVNAAPDTSKQLGTIIVSVEKFSIGQGYYYKPTELPFYEGDTGASIADRMLGGSSGYKGTYSEDKGFYLSSIYGADTTGVATIPRYITQMDPMMAPSTEDNSGNPEVPNLGEFAYSSQAGWMYSVNGNFPKVGLSAYHPTDGDVMRLQFTVWGLGADIGDDYNEEHAVLAKREPLTKALAKLNNRADKDALLLKPWINEAYEHAEAVITNLEKNQAECDAATQWLNHAVAAENLTGIALSDQKIALGIGNTQTLEVQFLPETCSVPEGIKWSSNDTDVVYIEADGTITAQSEGSAVITATIGNYRASCEVTVKPIIPMTGIALSRNTASLMKTETLTLGVNYQPGDTTDDRNAEWFSADESIVSVWQNGTLEAHAVGETVVTVRVGAFEDFCKVTVVENARDVVDAVAKEIKALNETSTLAEVVKAQRDFSALTEAQLGLLSPLEAAGLPVILRQSMDRVTEKWAIEMQTTTCAVDDELKNGLLTDQTLFNFIKLYSDYETLRMLQGLPENALKLIMTQEPTVLQKQAEIKKNNRSSSGVSVSESAGIPWTVQVKATAEQLSTDEQNKIKSDLTFQDPEICSAYSILLRDFAAAQTPQDIPEWNTEGKMLKVTMPAGTFKKNPLVKQNLTLINGEIKMVLDPVRNYNEIRQTLSFEIEKVHQKMIFVCDHRIPLENFELSDTTKNIMLDETDLSFMLSVKKYEPYDTTDKTRIKWESSDSAVAGVDDTGKVTGIKKGKTTITATINGVKRECQVTVKMNVLPEFKSFWPTFRKDNSNMAIVNTPLPNTGVNLKEKWIQGDLIASKLGTVGTPLIIEDKVYVSADKYLYRLNKETGAIEKKVELCGKVGYFSFATYGDGMIFVPIYGGIVEAFNADTMDSLWKTQAMGGQSNSQLTYADGYIYTGTWRGSSAGSTGKYACFDTSKNKDKVGDIKMPHWISEDQKGYYWSGATIVGDAVIFGGESGQLQSRNRKTGTIIDSYQCTGMIRSCIAYDEKLKALYFTAGEGDFTNGSENGKCYKVSVDSNGHFKGAQNVDLPAPATTTPVVYNGRVYVPTGKAFSWNGTLSVIDANSMGIIYNAEIGGSSKSSPLLTTAFSNDGQQTVYLYMTINNMDGAIVRMKDWAGNTTSQVEVIYRPSDAEREHLTTSLNCDENGTIYYRNDRGRLMALTGTTEPVRASLGAVDGRRQGRSNAFMGMRNDGSNGNQRTIKAADNPVEEAFEPWKFEGTYVPPNQTISKQPQENKLKKAAVVLSLSAVGMSIIYTMIAGLLQPGIIKKL